MASRSILTPEGRLKLIERLSSIRAVAQFDKPGETQAETLVHALMDLEQSFRAILEIHLPNLLDPSLSSEQINDVLLEIGEELRHVLYHVKDAEYFGYLDDQTV